MSFVRPHPRTLIESGSLSVLQIKQAYKSGTRECSGKFYVIGNRHKEKRPKEKKLKIEGQRMLIGG